jgi:hypothetical protein
MGIFDEMVTEVEAYPETHVVLEIVDVSFTEDVLNQGEVGDFKVRVTNNGALDLTDVTLKVEGRNGATVRDGLAADFAPDFISGELPTIDAHGGFQETTFASFLAPDREQESKTLVKATLQRWNANTNHIFTDHSDPHPNVPKGTFAAEVVPS